jgi:hypothetical protein
LVHHYDIEPRDTGWKFECDACQWATIYRDSFKRHWTEQPGFRDGFNVVAALTHIPIPAWFAVDAAGNEYQGRLIYAPRIAKQAAARVQAPCGPRLVAYRRVRKNELKARRMQKAAETENEEGE